MSDIGFYGVAAAAVSLAMLAVATLALLIEGALWYRRRRAGTAGPGALTFIAPAVYAGLAIAILVAVEEGELALKEAMDLAAPVVAVVGLLVWMGLRVLVVRTSAGNIAARSAGTE